MSETAVEKLKQLRQDWKRDPDRPVGWWTRLTANPDGSANFMKWECGLPGPKDTLWEAGEYRINMEFREGYPSKVYPSGTICLSILDEDKGWAPNTTIKQMLQAIFEMFDSPNV